MNYLNIIKNGIIKDNPTFVLMLGMCPTLATTTSASNGMAMGLATMAVLICTNVVISSIKNLTPDKVRIPVFIVVIAAFVTLLQRRWDSSSRLSWSTASSLDAPRLLPPRTRRWHRSSTVSASDWALRWPSLF